MFCLDLRRLNFDSQSGITVHFRNWVVQLFFPESVLRVFIRPQVEGMNNMAGFLICTHDPSIWPERRVVWHIGLEGGGRLYLADDKAQFQKKVLKDILKCHSSHHSLVNPAHDFGPFIVLSIGWQGVIVSLFVDTWRLRGGGGGGGGKNGKFMKQKKKPKINSVDWQHTRVDNKKANKAEASRFCSTASRKNGTTSESTLLASIWGTPKG